MAEGVRLSTSGLQAGALENEAPKRTQFPLSGRAAPEGRMIKAHHRGLTGPIRRIRWFYVVDKRKRQASLGARV